MRLLSLLMMGHSRYIMFMLEDLSPG